MAGSFVSFLIWALVVNFLSQLTYCREAVTFHIEEYGDVGLYVDSQISSGHYSPFRSKRSAVCPKPEHSSSSDVSAHRFELTENKDSSSYNTLFLLWTGKNYQSRIIALAQDQVQASSAFYRSKLNENKTKYEFEKIADTFDNLALVTAEQNPSDGNHIIIIGLRNSAFESCSSSTGGDQFDCHQMPVGYHDIKAFHFEGQNVIAIMRSGSAFFASRQDLVLSQDFGATWKVIANDVSSALFQPGNSNVIFVMMAKASSAYSLFFATQVTYLKKIEISKTSNPTTSDLPGLADVTGISGFQYVGKFLHVVAEDEEGHKVLKMSSDHGQTFSDTHLPALQSGQYVNVLDMSDELVFVHITDPIDNTVGKLYTSGMGGLFYSLSLDNHVHLDFYKVLSMNGVYITTQKLPDGSLTSLISTDRGAIWKKITLNNCKQATCTIQVINTQLLALHADGDFSKPPLASAPYSSTNATGLIVVHGFLAEKVSYDVTFRKYTYPTEPNVFVSDDGGFTWIMAPADTLKGAYHIRIGDSGGIIMAMPMSGDIHSIFYSMDEGSCWQKEPLDSDKLPSNFTTTTKNGPVMQPGGKSLRLSVFGYVATGSVPVWTVVDINFKNVVGKPCLNDDFEFWSGHRLCYLGATETTKRVKKTSWCYKGEEFEPSSSWESCPCKREDFECDYGFDRDESTNECIKNEEFKTEVTYCLDDQLYQLESSGYRRIPGDTCDNTSAKATFINSEPQTHKNLHKPCDEGDPSTYISLSEVQSRVCSSQQLSQRGSSGKAGQGAVAAIVILFIISVVLCVALIALFTKYRRLRRQYDYSSFENTSWTRDTNTTHSAGQQQRQNEAANISDSAANGRSYSRLTDSNSSPDTDLLNL